MCVVREVRWVDVWRGKIITPVYKQHSFIIGYNHSYPNMQLNCSILLWNRQQAMHKRARALNFDSLMYFVNNSTSNEAVPVSRYDR
jgi:hypothetical protein